MDDLTLTLSPEPKVTVDDYRASQRFVKVARPELPNSCWWNQETLKNTTRETTLKRNNKKKHLEVKVKIFGRIFLTEGFFDQNDILICKFLIEIVTIKKVELDQLKNQSRQASNALNHLLSSKQMCPEVYAEAEKCLLVSTEKARVLNTWFALFEGKYKFKY